MEKGYLKKVLLFLSRPLAAIRSSDKRGEMMEKELFTQQDIDNGLDRNVVYYFDTMYMCGYFLRLLELISEGEGLSTDGAYCDDPDMESDDESEHFEGIKFRVGFPQTEEEEKKNTTIVSEETYYRYVRLASERYVKLHPEDTQKVNSFLALLPM